MPYKDPEVAKVKARERKKRRQEREREKRVAMGLPADGRGRHCNHAKGADAGRWNPGKLSSTEGYVKIRVGATHPLADPNGYVYEHKIVAVTAYGSEAISGMVIHHINGDRADNRIENLEIMTVAAHNAIHNIERGRDHAGQFMGKKKAGRLLDGETWDEMPAIRHSSTI